jgi:hypothetical protein
MAQMVYNNKALEATGQTPYFANHRKYLNLFKRTLPSPKAEAAIKSAEEIKKIYEENKQEALTRSEPEHFIY